MAKVCNVAGLADSLFSAGAVFFPDGSLAFTSRSGKTKVELEFKQVGNKWIAEYRYRFRCGGFQGHFIPLSVYSKGNASWEGAIESAALRLRRDAETRCGDKDRLVATQRKELAELLAWANTQIRHTAPELANPMFDIFSGIPEFVLRLFDNAQANEGYEASKDIQK